MKLDLLASVSLLLTTLAATYQSTAVTASGVQAARRLRAAVLIDPRSAITAHCQAQAGGRSSPSRQALEQPKLFECPLSLQWRAEQSWQDTCEAALRPHDARLRPPRYYRIALACSWSWPGLGPPISLPLLATEIFR